MPSGPVTRFQRDDLLGAEASGGFLGARIEENGLRGRHAWAELDDHGLAEGQPAELYRDLYAVAGQAWVDAGAVDHYVLAAPDGPERDAWLGLSFFVQQVHAARSLTGLEQTPPPHGYAIRAATPDDAAEVVALAFQLYRQHLAAPVWAGGRADSPEEAEREWRADLTEKGMAAFLIERDRAPAGFVLMQERDPQTVNLHVAAVDAAHRGRGLGTALTTHVLDWARQQGYATCLVDWRAANLAASRFWPARGFRAGHCRYVRYLRPANDVWR
ncbi:MAG TPA: GNAT family N-acetyltransferase [Gaiellales bacterium]|nr:GNAT family N-acetyltransferase [Gaiellales bacterium]